MTGAIQHMRWDPKRLAKRHRSGFALVAAMMVMLLLTALGIMAMVTSTAEMKVTNNLGEDEFMFGFGEQGVDRVRSHLHYLNQGIFGRTDGAAFLNTNVKQVLADVRDIYMFSAPPGALSTHANFSLNAWMDPKDYTAGNWDRGYSREVAVAVTVRNTATDFQKGFRAKLRPYSIWDFAYYSQNHNPAARKVNNVVACGSPSNTWYNCQTTFHQGDQVIGDTFVRTRDDANNDDTVLYMRGAPRFEGRAMWRGLRGYDYSGNSDFQTKGGSSTSTYPTSHHGFKNYASDVDLFPLTYLANGSGADTQWFRSNADIVLAKRTGFAYKIVFRNDLDLNSNGSYEFESKVTSHINSEVNDGTASGDDRGVFLLYSLPWFGGVSTHEQEMRAAFYGDTMGERDKAMTKIVAGQSYTPSVSWASNVAGGCTNLRNNIAGNVTFSPAPVPWDISPSFYFFQVPSVNSAYQLTTGQGTCTGVRNGIIYVEGDVMVEGILDGKVTIVAAGNIYLSHEVQYEETPSRRMQSYANPSAIDMLGLFATGNIIIPNNREARWREDRDNGYTIFSRDYRDDWSDNITDGTAAGPDSGKEKMAYDDGNEEVHAVMVSFGRGACTFSSGVATCPAPTAAQIRDFQTGFYATPRTTDETAWGPAVTDGGGFSYLGNSSGTLTVWGAIIQDYSGRVGYDHATSTCTQGSGTGCYFMGHTLVVKYDDRLRYTLPAIPYDRNTLRGVPYGGAAWETTLWEQIPASSASAAVW